MNKYLYKLFNDQLKLITKELLSFFVFIFYFNYMEQRTMKLKENQ